jgi:exodeoxyribonuclease V beta subunit
MQPLNPLSCPLTGRLLIEASAGTGKTYTIAILFLRLLLQARLEVEQILVVTFTEAATAELRMRIWARLREALQQLRGLAQLPPDPLLLELLDGIDGRQEAQQRLEDALVRMDEASVFTIHGFCGRVLQENAFESGMPFEVELISDERALRHEIICDFWRSRLAVLDLPQTVWLREQWKTPEALLSALQGTLPHTGLSLIPVLGLADAELAWREVEARYQELCAAWAEQGAEISELLTTSKALNRRSYSKSVVTKALAAMGELIEAGSCPSCLAEKQLERFTPSMLEEKTKAGETPPAHPLFDLVAGFIAAHSSALGMRRAAWLREAHAYLLSELARRKEERRQLYFDDLLRRMQQALQGESGERFAAAVRRRFPVAMIDEFQDTDPLQYQIFSGIYPGETDNALFMIGDPKQAIYSFRGADIFTYMQARRETASAGTQYTLDTNWRSASALVGCVNALFGHKRLVSPFIYEPDIQFQPVNASPNADQAPLRLAGEAVPPLQFWLMSGEAERPLDLGPARERAAAASAGRIAELLNQAQQGAALIGERPLRARDIAVLVRTHAEGLQMQQSLSACGVTSAAIGRESVFASQEAKELALLLNAIAAPEDEAQLRAALVTSLFGCSLSDLAALAVDDLAWGELLQRFRRYRQAWVQQGFMVGFQALLHREAIPQQLLSQPGGERRITNLLQLAELLQLASRERPGIDGVLRWFAEQRADTSPSDESELRLESDAALVQIVTIHKSKGLEYPVVFLPFPWGIGKKSDLLLFHNPASGRLCLDLGSDDAAAHLALAERECLAERLRLFYVALTRAKHLCVMSWGRIKGAEQSAPAWLLHQTSDGGEPRVAMPETLQGIAADIQRLAEETGAELLIEALPNEATASYRSSGKECAGLRVAELAGLVPHRWRLASFSSLVAGVESEWPDHDAEDGGIDTARQTAPLEDIFRFPRGPRAGTFIHSLLERCDFSAIDQEGLQAFVQRQLQSHGFESHWGEALSGMLRDLLTTELDQNGLQLCQISRADRLDEMEFFYPLASLSRPGLQEVLAKFADYRSSGEGLSFDSVEGLMRGFIDLVFQHQGRFYLADYKSNHLGNRPEEYHCEALEQAMQAHRYRLQYLIYTLALHRYLRQRLPDYDYQRHFGGVYYLFVRGIRPGSRHGIFYDRPPLALIEALDRLCAEGQA